MARSNTRQWAFELLDTRCVLNGTSMSWVLFAEGPLVSHVEIKSENPQVEIQVEYKPILPSTTVDQAAGAPRMEQTEIIIRSFSAPVNLSEGAAQSHGNVPSPGSELSQVATTSSPAYLENTSGEEPGHSILASPTADDTGGTDLYPNVLPALQTTKSQLVAPESLYLQQSPSASGVASGTSSRDQQNSVGPMRDANFVPGPPPQTSGKDTGPLPLSNGRDERLPSIVPISNNAAIQGVALGTNNLGVPGNPPTEQNGPGRIPAPLIATPSSPGTVDVRFLVARTEESFSLPDLEDNSSSSELLSDIPPFDLSSLESSVKRFFDQIDAQGLQLAQSQVNLLFASGLMAAAGSIALEFARRKIQAPVPALPPHRNGSIPYSDYP